MLGDRFEKAYLHTLQGGCEKCPAVRPLRGVMSNLRDRSGNVKPDRFRILLSYFVVDRGILVCLMPS